MASVQFPLQVIQLEVTIVLVCQLERYAHALPAVVKGVEQQQSIDSTWVRAQIRTSDISTPCRLISKEEVA